MLKPLEGGAIKLTKKDYPNGQHHCVPTGWVARVDEHVHLNKNADGTKIGLEGRRRVLCEPWRVTPAGLDQAQYGPPESDGRLRSSLP